MPVLRSAMARAWTSLIATGRTRASSTTKSLPSPFILRNSLGANPSMAGLYGERGGESQPPGAPSLRLSAATSARANYMPQRRHEAALSDYSHDWQYHPGSLRPRDTGQSGRSEIRHGRNSAP